LFKRLLAGPLKERNIYSLPYENPDVVQIFHNWLYSGKIVGESDKDLTVINFIYIYILADYYIIRELKDRALELYLLHFIKDWTAPQEFTRPIYENTSGESSLRRLHVDILVETFGFENLREWLNDDPKEFLSDVMEACCNRKIVLGSCPGIANERGVH
jgi:hypothetical protein